MTPLNHVHRNPYAFNGNPTVEFRNENLFSEQVLWKLVLITALSYFIWSDKVSIVFGPVSDDAMEEPSGRSEHVAMFDALPSGIAKRNSQETCVVLPEGDVNNVTYAIDHQYAERYHVDPSDVEERMSECRNYVSRYAPVAIAEMRRTGVPASVSLAQGLLESNAGGSKLSKATNNHFGIKCFSRRCKKGHCLNFTDDSHKDFFVKYANAWESYQAHSNFLKNTGRYAPLFNLESTDYRNWARGLTRAGYATDKQYGDKLIAIIQSLKLYRFDRQ